MISMNQKLKILPPTMRDKKRYIAFEVIFKGNMEREDIIGMILDASLYLHGAYGTGKFDIWVVKLWNCSNQGSADNFKNEKKIKGILRCRRGEVDSVRAVLPTITKFRGNDVVFHTLGISGTIKSATKNFIKL
jgi:ribonuclease P/MRP protein subunit POP5